MLNSFIVFTLIWIVPVNVGWAQQSYTPYRLPEGRRLISNSEVYQGFTLEEMKELLTMDMDLRTADERIKFMSGIMDDQESMISTMKKQLDIRTEQYQVSEDERKRLLDKWSKENELRHIAENKTPWGSWVAWTAAATAATVALVLGGVLIYDKN